MALKWQARMLEKHNGSLFRDLCVDSEPEGQGAGEEAGITTGPNAQAVN